MSRHVGSGVGLTVRERLVMRWKQVDGALAALASVKDPRTASRNGELEARLRSQLDRIEHEFWQDWLAEHRPQR